MKCFVFFRMEECLHLVCETIGVHEDDEVGVDVICSLYKSVFLITASLEDTKRAISQVRGQSGGLLCSARGVLHVLLVMEKQQENREELYWELQMLKAGRIDRTLKQNKQSSTINFVSKQQEQDPEQFSILCLQNRAKRLYTRLVLDGVWSVLPSLSQRNAGIMQPGRISPSSTDILQLLYYKYDVIKEHLYREMLQDEYGVVWWDSMSEWDQTDCVCELGAFVEQAFRHRDLFQLSGLPGALRCYRSCGSVVLRGCPQNVKPRDQAWSSKPREQAWSAVNFLSELESHYQDEKEAISALINRVGQEALRVIYLSMCVAVRRAERENQSYTALLVARQHWDRWPYMRGSASQDLARIWLQENIDPTAKKQQGWKKGNCAQQAVLQFLVLCQEQERKQLVEILHRVSLSDLQGLRNIQENNDVVHGNVMDQNCVLSLQQIKASLQEAHGSCTGPFIPGCSQIDVSWVECAIHLLTQLTQTHEEEAWTVLYSLPDLHPEGLWTLLRKYESELHRPSFHNLHEVLQSRVPAHASRGTNTVNADNEREPEHEEPSDGEKQELCTGCGMVLDPEDTPYLEILCVKDPRNEVSMMESRDGDRKREEGDIKSKGDLEEIPVEKQNSLITLAWSKPAHGENHIQELNSTQQKAEAVSIAVQEDRANNTRGLDTNPHDVNIYTHQENISTVSLQPSAQYEETHSDNEKGETQTQIQQDHSGFITAGQQQEIIRDDELTHQPLGDTYQPESTPPTASQLLQNTDTTDTSTAPASVHFPDSKSTQTFETHEMEVSLQEQRNEEICERVGEEQQLQREATMRCLVDIQRKAERRWQRDRDRQLLRVQERLAIVQTRKADEDLLGLTQEDTLRHLTDTLRQEDEQQQKTLVREKLQQMRRERSCILQTRRERNTAGFKELLAPTAQRMTETEEGH
ncbi:uncharacterized protein LOC125253868 isoform X2 [Megalobrama amblycephala]|uniref:uncharacterized protein LOC125253868 isoform X2 n=1 Tax=Megalobrama amblycephala TaxID=75352 RepID=UPI002014454F|nr:uncharacterized protein LOC125253868 isoform X2 [Megalobrama amblycephala]